MALDDTTDGLVCLNGMGRSYYNPSNIINIDRDEGERRWFGRKKERMIGLRLLETSG